MELQGLRRESVWQSFVNVYRPMPVKSLSPAPLEVLAQ